MRTQVKAIGRQKRTVEFCLGDIAAAQQMQVLNHLTGDLKLEGRVVDVVELGEPPELYAMVEVRGIKTPMLVPLAAIQ